MLHAAAVHGRDMATVVDWVTRHELDEPGVLLEDERCSQLAFSTLLGVPNTEARERSSIFSAAADALDAYSCEAASPPPGIRTSTRPRSCAPATPSTSTRRPRRRPPPRRWCAGCSPRSAARPTAPMPPASWPARVLFALDEVANIAPIDELPQIASEGGGQGLLLLAVAPGPHPGAARWGVQADGS